MGRVATTTSVAIDPFQPMLGTMTSDQVLKVVRDWDVLRLGSSEEVLSDGVGIIPKGDLDGSFETMEITVITSTLVCLMLPHQRKKLLGGPAFGLKVVVVGR